MPIASAVRDTLPPFARSARSRNSRSKPSTAARLASAKGSSPGAAGAALAVACGRGESEQPSGAETGPAAPGAAPAAALDPTKGKRGGKIIIQQYGDPGGGLELFKIRNAGVHQLAGFTHDGLLEHRNGTPAHDGYDIEPQPNLAQTMPEQQDALTRARGDVARGLIEAYRAIGGGWQIRYNPAGAAALGGDVPPPLPKSDLPVNLVPAIEMIKPVIPPIDVDDLEELPRP